MAAVQPVIPPLPTFDLKHILVTTDFSDHSIAALRQAAAIAALHDSDLTVLHVVAPEPMIERSLEPAAWEYGDLIHAAESKMQKLESDEALGGLPHQMLVKHGDLEPVLKQVIEERRISLAVVGTHGRGGMTKLLLGSVAEEIFRISDCAVLTVGPQEDPPLLTHGRFHSIVYATDFSNASRLSLPYAIALARESEARLTLLHVVDGNSLAAMYLQTQLQEESRKSLREMLPESAMLPSAPDFEVTSGYPAEEILRVADLKKADLIVLGVHKSSGWRARTSAHLPWGTAHTVVCHAKCPVLTARG
jgi:nucleotide-binding universal stress UspA family protein